MSCSKAHELGTCESKYICDVKNTERWSENQQKDTALYHKNKAWTKYQTVRGNKL